MRVVSGRRVMWFNSRTLWLVVLALIAAPLAVEFTTRLATSRQLVAEEARLRREIALEERRAEVLSAYQAFVNSDAYVEWWARVRARMIKPGEVAVAPLTPIDRVKSVTLNSTQTPRDYPSEWWAAFFADLP